MLGVNTSVDVCSLDVTAVPVENRRIVAVNVDSVLSVLPRSRSVVPATIRTRAPVLRLMMPFVSITIVPKVRALVLADAITIRLRIPVRLVIVLLSAFSDSVAAYDSV